MRDLALLSLFKSCAAVEFCLEYRDKEVEREMIRLEQDEFFEKVKEKLYDVLKESDIDSCARMFNLHTKFLYEMIARKAIGKCRKEKEIGFENNLEGLGKESRFRIGRKVDLSECKAIYTTQSLYPRQIHTKNKHPSQWPSVSKSSLFQNLSPNPSPSSPNHPNLEIKPASEILKRAWSSLSNLS